MNPSLTVWTSNSTTLAQSRVAQIIRAARGGDAVYDSASIAGCSPADIKDCLNGAFDRLVSLTSVDTTLHIVAVTPLYEDNADRQLQLLCDACASLEHRITLHILGLAEGIRPIFDAKAKSDDCPAVDGKYQDLLRQLCDNANFEISYSLIDDYAENGAHIGFSMESLSRYIAVIQKAMMQGYYEILSPALVNAHRGDNLAIGVSSLSFDRDATARQMLGLGFIEALDNVGINNNEVDAQKAAREAESFLCGISERYPRLYENSIKPLYKEQGIDEGRVMAQAAEILDNDIEELKEEILTLLKNDSLTLPEKEAILALILGRDNENIRGMQFLHDGALLDDACEHPIELYVEAFNAHCRPFKYLPVRKDFEALKKYEWNDDTQKLEESPENENAMNPLPEIKELKQEIINATSFIRDKQDELENIQKSVKQRKDVEDIKRQWHKPEGALKDIEYKEQPLEEQYVPSAGLEVKDAVDLRKFFTPVKNQRDLGSCTSFASVAMYEAMMCRAGIEGVTDMSPAYLYYYSNILKGRPAGGSNFYDQLEVLGTHGVCREDLYVYDSDSPETKPSEQAEEDAKNHRVIAAKQIPLCDEPDKSETLKRNHTLLTSALSEGFPIGISLKVYDNLGKDGAFILHPEDAPSAKEDGWHAMVIVGYSEENNFYIVRNSWGEEFGESGYCYIPTAYIDDPEYLNFACIITEISDSAEGAPAEVPTVVADFAATESEIRMAAIRNAIAKVRVDLKNSQKLYAEYYKYYQRLVMQLTIPKVQTDIWRAAELAQTFNCIDVEKKKKELEDTFVDKFKAYKSRLRYSIISLTIVALGLGVTTYSSRSTLLFILFCITAGCLLLTIIGYPFWKRIKRRELQEELDNIAVEAKQQAERLFELQMRFHAAGMWLQKFHKLSNEIGNVYDRLVSYNSTLRAWQESYSRQIDAPARPEGQMFRILDASPLLQEFFNRNKKTIVSQVDLIKLFEDYQVNPDTLDASHQRLRDAVASVIDSLMADFNIVNFLLGDEYPYLNQVNLQNEISTLINVGQPSCRNKAMNATTSMRFMLANITHDREGQWSSVVSKLFPMRPIQIKAASSTDIILLTIHPQEAFSM